jgi:hypothetical protein
MKMIKKNEKKYVYMNFLFFGWELILEYDPELVELCLLIKLVIQYLLKVTFDFAPLI